MSFCAFFLAFCLYGWDFQKPFQFSAAQQIWDTQQKYFILEGDVYLEQQDEKFSAHRIEIDQKEEKIHAFGKCEYQLGDFFAQADSLYFSTRRKEGLLKKASIRYGIIHFKSEQIHKTSEKIYQAQEAVYTTCQECIPMWSIFAKEMSIDLENASTFKNVFFYIKEIPIFWLPYLTFPVSQKRRTGFLFPHFGFSEFYGLRLMQPFFLVTSDFSDMTIALGTYSKRGWRLEYEMRARMRQNGFILAKAFYTQDINFAHQYNASASRWYLNFEQGYNVHPLFQEKFLLQEVNDALYPYHYHNDIGWSRDTTYLTSRLVLTSSTQPLGFGAAISRYRGLVHDLHTPDSYQSQWVPQLDLYMLDQKLFSSLWTNIKMFANRFEPLSENKNNPFLRQANRFLFFPQFHSRFIIADVWEMRGTYEVPASIYTFPALPGYFQGYVHLQLENFIHFSKVYTLSSTQKIKHTFSPYLKYSWIPLYYQDTQHPFYLQLQRYKTVRLSGAHFDTYDYIPYNSYQLGSVYLPPLGHSLYLGVTSDWIKRFLNGNDSEYKKIVRWNNYQVLNLLNLSEFKKIFGRFISDASVQMQAFELQLYYAYDFELEKNFRHIFLSSLSWTWDTLDRSRVMISYLNHSQTLHTNHLNFLISTAISDYFLPSAYFSYTLEQKRFHQFGIRANIKNQTLCWFVDAGVDYELGINVPNFNLYVGLNLGEPMKLSSAVFHGFSHQYD